MSAKRTPTRIPTTLTGLLAGAAIAAAGFVGAGAGGPGASAPGHPAAARPAAGLATAATSGGTGAITLTAYGVPRGRPRPDRHGPSPERHHPGRHHPARHRPGRRHPRRHWPRRGGPGLSQAPQQIAWGLMASFRWAPWQFRYLNLLWMRESGWNRYATNPASGAYGIPQAMPGDKMASAGPDWRSSARTQILWGMGYIRGRYVTPYEAWQHELRYGWY